MTDKTASLKKDIDFLGKWVKKVAKNEKVSYQEALTESLTIKEKALNIYETMLSRDKKTGGPEDPFMGAIEKLVKGNEAAIREKITELVYKGEIEPTAYYGVLLEIMKEKSPLAHTFQDMRRFTIKDMTTKGCGACMACVACIACVACGVSGAVATGAAGATGATAAVVA